MIFYLWKGSLAAYTVILGSEKGGFREVFSPSIGLCVKSLIVTAVGLLACAPGQTYTIEGKIEHVERLPAVEQRFTPGVQFNESVQLSPNNFWVQIPKWLAGSWSAREETAVLFQDFRSGRSRSQHESFKAKQDFTYGQQEDKSGQVWHYVGVPYSSKTVHTNSEEIHEVKEKRFLRADQEEVSFRAVATVLFVDNISTRIQRTYQQESLTTYKPIADDRIAMTASTKVFDSAGRPQTMQDNEAIIKRYKHFHPTNVQDGKDLKALFIEFMTAKGMANLLPD